MRVLQQVFRIYTEPDRLESTIRFYEEVQGTKCERRVHITETNVDAAKVGGFLILAADREMIDAIRFVNAIFYVDSLDGCLDWINSNGAEIIHAPRTVTGGKNFTARHPDGLVVEYFAAAKKEKG